MILYLFNNTHLFTIKLPVKVSGMYPIYANNQFVANITSVNNKWIVELAAGNTSDDLIKVNNELVMYKNITILSSTKDAFQLVAIPKYDKNVTMYDVKNTVLTIGDNPNCDIYFSNNNDNIGNNFLKIFKGQNNLWYVETKTPNFFQSGKRVVSGTNIFMGDYIFYYGLKVIFLGSMVIINNPNQKVRVNANNLALKNSQEDFNLISDPDTDDETPLFNNEDYFFKSPRFNFVVKEETVNIDEPPEPVKENDVPMLLVVGPQLTMVGTSILSMTNYIGLYIGGNTSAFRFYIMIGTMLVTITGALLWPSATRAFNRKRARKMEQKRQKKYTEYLETKKKEIETIKMEQKNNIAATHPSIDQCLTVIQNKTKELWQRNIDHDDFLSIRLGIGSVPTKLKINIPEEKFTLEDEDNLFLALKDIVDESLTIKDIPISYNLTKQSINAVIGNQTLINKFMDCLFLQMMTFHSYTDLKIIVYTKDTSKWDYLKIIPHCWDNQKNIRYFTSTVEELATVTADLEKIFDDRVEDNEEVKLEDDGTDEASKKNYTDFRPYYLLFIDDMASVRNVSLIKKILRYKRNMGFSIIITSNNISTVPSETKDFIFISENESGIMTNEINKDNQTFKADFNNNVNIYNYAQRLANIPVLIDAEKYELPASLSFLELYNLGKIEQLNSLTRWSENNPVNSLSVPVGIDQSGEIFKMDIHEKAYGPHGLIAGTTGSGKSEWIITYILSLAVNFSPDEVQFVLIDYKGGGLALSFENSELGIKLPHLAGTITNLEKSEMYRSVAAIESEMKRRQAIFNVAREKLKEGSMNIYKYQQFYRKNLVDEPLSHLLIICDEFAELKQQQPEFMEQLMSISRIGRSLGIHLILATQKPSGVVNDQIWSNSKFKVCLKVQDKSDSNEVLKKPDAAYLKQTGAFYLQVGIDDYYNLGQAAWAGAKYYPSDVIKKKIDESIRYIDNIGRTIEFYEEQRDEKRESKGEELLNIVEYISNISKEITLKSKPLWLENVKPKQYISELFEKYSRPNPTLFNYNIAIGEYDEPREQKQGLLELNLADGNVAIIGQNGSGKENLISTIIWSSLIEHTPYEIAYYIIDFGSETLKKFAKFPHVGEVVFQEDNDKVGAVLDLVIEEIDNRKNILSDYNGSFNYYNKVNQNKMPLIVTLINNFDVFNETFPPLFDIMTNLFRDAPKYGVIFIVTATSPTTLRPRQLQFFNHTIVMQLADEHQYRSITNCRRGLIPMKVKGRGICKTDANNNDSYSEFQTSFIANEDDELEIIRNFAEKCVDHYSYKVKQLAKIPEDVTSANLVKYITTLEEVPIGLNLYEKDISKYNFLSEKIHLFTGKKISDHIEFIYALASTLSNVPNVKVRVIDMIDIFKKPILDIRLFNEDIDVVFGALEKDVLTRTETQDYGVNIIIGLGQFKRKLSSGGIEIFRNTFNNLPNSKKIIYILIDDYDKLRTLKLESWFNQVNQSNGLWLGPGLANQSLFENREVNSEDKKFDYKGLAYKLENKDYKVTKVMMDGDE